MKTDDIIAIAEAHVVFADQSEEKGALIAMRAEARFAAASYESAAKQASVASAARAAELYRAAARCWDRGRSFVKGRGARRMAAKLEEEQAETDRRHAAFMEAV
jgi:hypothetical protein